MDEKFIFAPISTIQDRRLTLMQLRVLLALFSFRGKNSDTVFPKRETLSERCGYTIQNISAVTGQLVELGWIEKIGNGGRSSPCKYKITVPEQKTVLSSETVSGSDTKTVSGSDTKTVSGSDTGKELTNELTNELIKELCDKFKKPTLFEIQNFISENGLSIDGEKFFYHYETNGWMVGKSKMKNWHMALKGWERRESEFKKTGGNNAGSSRLNKKLSALERFEQANNGFGGQQHESSTSIIEGECKSV